MHCLLYLTKGLAAVNHQVQRVSQLIQEVAGVEVSGVLLGANVSIQVAKEEFCEATLGKDLGEVVMLNSLKPSNQLQWFS